VSFIHVGSRAIKTKTRCVSVWVALGPKRGGGGYLPQTNCRQFCSKNIYLYRRIKLVYEIPLKIIPYILTFSGYFKGLPTLSSSEPMEKFPRFFPLYFPNFSNFPHFYLAHISVTYYITCSRSPATATLRPVSRERLYPAPK
jgi:hypothetical protein